MSLDMTAGKNQESISHSEEAILVLCYQEDESGDFPELSRLWDEFYDGPRIDPNRAGQIAEEFRSAIPKITKELDPNLGDSALRLADFFRTAFENQSWVHSVSD